MLIREEIKDVKPYSWEKSSREIAQEFNLPVERVIRFDLNTSPGIPEKLLEKAVQALPGLGIHEYPDTSYMTLRSLLAEYCSVDINQVSVTNGADEALDIVSKIFLNSESNVVVSEPSYSMYRIVSKIMGATFKAALRNEDLTDNPDRIKALTDEKTRVVFLCSPNNPTGTCISRPTLRDLLESLDCAIVVDEAYYEFSGETFVDLTQEYDKLIILRTFSKAFSLAGARVGYIVASENTVNLLNKVRPPNSLSVFSLELARLALLNKGLMETNVSTILKARKSLKKDLAELGLYAHPSRANFMLVDFEDKSPASIHRLLMGRGIVVRDVSSMPLLEKCLRITVRNESDNQRLLRTLSEVLYL